MYKVYIFGMGYVGLTFGVYASKSTKIYGIENDLKSAQSINDRNISIVDKGILDGLNEALDKKNLVIGNNLADVFDNDNKNTNVFIITPGTPLNDDGSVNLSSINTIVKDIKSYVKEGDIVILRSTVKVGITEEIAKKFKKIKNINIGFCPERTVEGIALEELKNLPQIIGANDQHTYLNIKKFFSYINISSLNIISIKEAELTKLLCNSERDLNFALANEIAYICENIGISAKNVINAASKDYSRSSLKKPGIVGGPCLEKDPYILKESVPLYNFKLLSISREVNEEIINVALTRIKKNVTNKNSIKKIAILGCAFKGFPVTADVRGSLIYEIKDGLKNIYSDCKFFYHDFLNEEVNKQDITLNCSSDVLEVSANSDIIILQNNHPEYAKMNWEAIDKNLRKNSIVYDFWNQLDSKDFKNSKYLSLGEGS
tara:strand:- start:2451 stop:3743 length:1293 start_codon:yes stop_codon:yes gene_type:complete